VTTRVLHLHTLDLATGSGLNTLATLRGLRALGFDAELACGDPDGDARERLSCMAEREGIPVTRLRHLGRRTDPVRDARALAEIAALIRRRGARVVHTHNSKAGLLGRIAARACLVPAVVHTVHGWAFEQAPSAAARSLYRTIERGAARLAHRTILVSRALETTARDAGIPAGNRRTVLYSGIDLDAFRSARRDPALRARLGADERTFLVGQVARIWEGKGHETLLDAFGRLRRECPRAVLAIVGDGPGRRLLERRATTRGLSPFVRFTGHRNDVAAVTAQLDAATLLSRYEGMGRVVLEAFAAGVPVVASRVGGITELVREGANALLVAPGDVPGVAAALGRMACDAGLRARMAAAAREGVDERFDAARMVERIAEIYREALAGTRPALPATGLAAGSPALTTIPGGGKSCT
jgi:glycosyltransferase involved in cell wall biosynthesis